jgi:ribosome maturation factor RimP
VEDLEERIRSMVEPVLARHEAELVELQVRSGRTRLVRVIADRPGGINLDTCAAVSAEISRMLDADDPIPGQYMLEVTSPGLDRPLKRPEDFRRNLGQRVRVVLAQTQHEGTIEAVTDDAVTIRQNRETVVIRLDDIAKAKVLLPW